MRRLGLFSPQISYHPPPLSERKVNGVSSDAADTRTSPRSSSQERRNEATHEAKSLVRRSAADERDGQAAVDQSLEMFRARNRRGGEEKNQATGWRARRSRRT